MKMTVNLVLTIILYFSVTFINGSSLFIYSYDTLIQDVQADYLDKIETYVYLDPTSNSTTYVVCIATLSTQDQLGRVYIEKRKFVIGETGSSGPERIAVANQFDTDKQYKDINIMDGPNECVFAAISTDNVLYVGTGVTGFNGIAFNRDRVKLTGINEYSYLTFSQDRFGTHPPPELFSYVFSSNHSLDAVRLPNGSHICAAAGTPTGSARSLQLFGNNTDTGVLYQVSAVYPSIGAFADSRLWVCGEDQTAGIVCGYHPQGSSADDSFTIRPNTAAVSYHKPIISLLNPTNSMLCMGSIITNKANNTSQYEIAIVGRDRVLQTTRKRADAFILHAVAKNGFIFATYATSNATQMDVYYYGDVAPVIPTPVSVPLSPPTSIPPTESPMTPDGTHTTVPTSAIQSPGNGTGDNALTSGELGAAIGVPIGVVVLGVGLLVLLLLLRKRKKSKKGNSKTEMDDNPSLLTSFSAADKYSAMPGSNNTTNTTTTNNTTTDTYVEFESVDVESRMKLPYKSLVLLRSIGAGSTGKVFLGEWHGAQVAIKVSNLMTTMDEFLIEARLALTIAPHPNLVQTFGVSLDGPNPCIVLEYCGGGSLDKIVFDKKTKLTNQQRKDYALKIAYGLLHLHQNNIVHRDLAARNILLANDGTPKISDFGMSRVIKDHSASGKTKATVIPLRWMSPENLREKTYSVKSDVWSYGILVWEIVTGLEPHEDEDQLLIGARIRDEGYHPLIPNECDPALQRVMEMCWQKDPNARPVSILKLLMGQWN